VEVPILFLDFDIPEASDQDGPTDHPNLGDQDMPPEAGGGYSRDRRCADLTKRAFSIEKSIT